MQTQPEDLHSPPNLSLFFQPDGGGAADTKLNRLRLRLGRFSTAKTKGGSAGGVSGPGSGGRALGLVDGNSTNTVNTVEDTEFSSSNVDSKSRAGVEVSAQYKHSKVKLESLYCTLVSILRFRFRKPSIAKF